jgi:hypothetical protein
MNRVRKKSGKCGLRNSWTAVLLLLGVELGRCSCFDAIRDLDSIRVPHLRPEFLHHLDEGEQNVGGD